MTCSAKVWTRPRSATISSHSGELVSTATRSRAPPDCSRQKANSACPCPRPREEGWTSPVAVRCPLASRNTEAAATASPVSSVPMMPGPLRK